MHKIKLSSCAELLPDTDQVVTPAMAHRIIKITSRPVMLDEPQIDFDPDDYPLRSFPKPSTGVPRRTNVGGR